MSIRIGRDRDQNSKHATSSESELMFGGRDAERERLCKPPGDGEGMREARYPGIDNEGYALIAVYADAG